MGTIFLVPMLVVVGTLAGCDPKADQDSCAKMVDHDYGIVDSRNHLSDTDNGKNMLDDLKKKTLDGCVGKMTKSGVECHLKAPTPVEMSACDKK
jgi:hypothetical protein